MKSFQLAYIINVYHTISEFKYFSLHISAFNFFASVLFHCQHFLAF